MPMLDPELRKLLVRAIVIPAVAVAVIFAGYHFLAAPRKAREEAAQATASATTSQAGMKSAQDALKITVDTQALNGRIDVVTQGNRDAILATPGASEALGTDIHDAGLRALCLRDTYRLQPACEQLLHADPVHP